MKLFVFPGNIEEDICEIASQQIPYMRTADFSAVVKECEKNLLKLIGCENGRIIPLTASGTGAMDAVVTNYVKRKGKALVLVAGSFGRRWRDLCNYYGCENFSFEVPFGKDADYDSLEDAIVKSEAKVFLCQHHETSTGQLFNIPQISEICKRHNVSLVVDVISSFLADQLDMNEMGIDICLTSSQKGLNISPGLSFVILAESVKNFDFAHGSYYFDFYDNLKNLERGQTPFSPATTLFLQLQARLRKNIIIGRQRIIDTVRKRALYFRNLCRENGWEMPVETPSNSITGFYVRRNGDILFPELLKQHIYIMPGGTPNYFRVSHLGLQSEKDLDDLASAIKEIENR